MAPADDALQALLRHARALVGFDLGSIADQLGMPVPARRLSSKGWAGQVIERELGAAGTAGHGVDFPALGVEVKTVPVWPALQPLESTHVCAIDPFTIGDESWESSYVRQKLARVLFVALEDPPEARTVGERRVSAVRLWSPAAEEEALLRRDFELVVGEYFRPGRVAELTAHVGQVMQVRPKGRNSADLRAGTGADGQRVLIGRCGFYLRPTFVARILR